VVWQTRKAAARWPATEVKERAIRQAFAATSRKGKRKEKGGSGEARGKEGANKRARQIAGDEVKIRIGKRKSELPDGLADEQQAERMQRRQQAKEQRRPSKLVQKAAANKERKKDERRERQDELKAMRKKRKEEKRASKRQQKARA
jgi:hypothetical protein